MKNKNYKIKIIILAVFSVVVSVQLYLIAYSLLIVYIENKYINYPQDLSQTESISTISPVGHAGSVSTVLKLAEGYYLAVAKKGGGYKLYELGTAPKVNNQIIKEAVDVAAEEGLAINKLSAGGTRFPMPEGILSTPTQEELASGGLKLAEHITEKFPQLEGDTANHLIGGSEGTAIWAKAKNFTEVEIDDFGKIVARGETKEVPEVTRAGMLDAIHPISDVDIVPLNKDFGISGLPIAKETIKREGAILVNETPYIPYGEISKDARIIMKEEVGGMHGVGLDNRAESCVYGKIDGKMKAALVETEDGKQYLVSTLPDLYGYKGLSAMVQYEAKPLQYNVDLDKISKAITDGGLYTDRQLVDYTKTLVEGFQKKWPDGQEFLATSMNKTLAGSEASEGIRGLFGEVLQDPKLFSKAAGQGSEIIPKISGTDKVIPPEELAAIAALGGMPPDPVAPLTEPKNTSETTTTQQQNLTTSLSTAKDVNANSYQELSPRVEDYKKSLEQGVPDEYKGIYKTYTDNHSTPTGSKVNYDDYAAKITGGQYQQAPPELAEAMAKYDNAVKIGQDLKNQYLVDTLKPQTTGEYAGLAATLLPGVASGGFWTSLAKVTGVDQAVKMAVDYDAERNLKNHEKYNSVLSQEYNAEYQNLRDLEKKLTDHKLGVNTLSDDELGKLNKDIEDSQKRMADNESQRRTTPYFQDYNNALQNLDKAQEIFDKSSTDFNDGKIRQADLDKAAEVYRQTASEYDKQSSLYDAHTKVADAYNSGKLGEGDDAIARADDLNKQLASGSIPPGQIDSKIEESAATPLTANNGGPLGGLIGVTVDTGKRVAEIYDGAVKVVKDMLPGGQTAEEKTQKPTEIQQGTDSAPTTDQVKTAAIQQANEEYQAELAKFNAGMGTQEDLDKAFAKLKKTITDYSGDRGEGTTVSTATDRTGEPINTGDRTDTDVWDDPLNYLSKEAYDKIYGSGSYDKAVESKASLPEIPYNPFVPSTAITQSAEDWQKFVAENYNEGDNGSQEKPFSCKECEKGDKLLTSMFELDPKTNDLKLKENWKDSAKINDRGGYFRFPSKQKILEKMVKQGLIAQNQMDSAMRKSATDVTLPNGTKVVNRNTNQEQMFKENPDKNKSGETDKVNFNDDDLKAE